MSEQACDYRRYESLDPDLIPPLWLIYADNPSDSGKAHSDVRQRWIQGDKAVHQAMGDFASFAEKGWCVVQISWSCPRSRLSLLQKLLNEDLRKGSVVYAELHALAVPGQLWKQRMTWRWRP